MVADTDGPDWFEGHLLKEDGTAGESGVFPGWYVDDSGLVKAELEAHLSDPFYLETTAYATMEKAALYVAPCYLLRVAC